MPPAYRNDPLIKHDSMPLTGLTGDKLRDYLSPGDVDEETQERFLNMSKSELYSLAIAGEDADRNHDPGVRPGPPRHVQERTQTWRRAFLEALRESGVIAHACRIADVSSKTVYFARSRDRMFRIAMEEARDEGIASMEIEARRRAIEGVRRTIWYQGEAVGHEVTYSDGLLQFMLKANLPEKYRDNQTIRHEGGVKNESKQVVIFKLPDNGRDSNTIDSSATPINGDDVTDVVDKAQEPYEFTPLPEPREPDFEDQLPRPKHRSDPDDPYTDPLMA